MLDSFDADVLILGSGFGGSVSALRLCEKGYRVIVLEQGRRIDAAAMRSAADSPRRFLWAPRLGWDGYFAQTVLEHLTVVRGVAVGGGSIVYASVLLEPHDAFFSQGSWSVLGIDWRRELAPHYATAKRMLGVTECPSQGRMDENLHEAARALGADASFGRTQLGIYFGEPGRTSPDPFFQGRGPERTACRLCGECMGGCPWGSKNSLDKNYLWLAERLGARVLSRHRVETIRPLEGGGYEVRAVDPLAPRAQRAPLTAREVIVACGTLGTIELLLRCRDHERSLPWLSRELGRVVRTNSEAIVAVTTEAPVEDPPDGPAISSHFWADARTHITQNRFPPAFEFLKWQLGPLVDGEDRRRRALRTLAAFIKRPRAATAAMRTHEWHRRASVLTVMQDRDNQIRLRWGRRRLPPFAAGLRSERAATGPAPSFIPEANDAARAFARASGGVPGNALTESLLGTATTSHLLGGCHMGSGPESGVIDSRHRVFGYPGLYVVDGAALSANVGVNPSLTIAALAERCIALFPKRGE